MNLFDRSPSSVRSFSFATAALLCAACASNSASDKPVRTAHFDVKQEFQVKVPPGTQQLRMWMVLPQEDKTEDISKLSIEAPMKWRETKDSEGNRMLYIEASAPIPETLKVVETFQVQRREQTGDIDPSATRPLNGEERTKMAHYLAPNQYIVIDDKIRALANEIVGSETNPLVVARKIYDWELANVDYWVKDPTNHKASPTGSSEYCLTTRTGNCSDFHSLYAALARSKGVPTRMLFGSYLKAELDGKDEDQSYHCWVEIYCPKIGWVPLDVAAADIFNEPIAINKDNEVLVRRATAAGYHGPDPQKVDYYFGNIEERRVTFTVGRDLVLDPKPAAGIVQAMPKAHIEADGKALVEKTDWTRKLTYSETKTEKEGGAK